MEDMLVPSLSAYDLANGPHSSSLPLVPGSPGIHDAISQLLVTAGHPDVITDEPAGAMRDLSFTEILGDLTDLDKFAPAADAGEHGGMADDSSVADECESWIDDTTVPAPPVLGQPRRAASRRRTTPRPPRSPRSAVSPRASVAASPAACSTDDEGCGLNPLPEYIGPLPESYWSLSEVQIATVTFKDFTKLMAKSKLTSKQIAEQKKLRRRVKNRYSARECSERKKKKVLNTDGENDALRSQVDELARVNDSLKHQHMLLQERFIEQQKRDADHVREKIYLQAEVQRLHQLVGVAASLQPLDPVGARTGLGGHPTFAATA